MVRDRVVGAVHRAGRHADAAEPARRGGADIPVRRLALAWNIAGGYAGLISFGHAAFFGIGAYTSTILLVRTGITPWIGLWAGALVAGAAGAVLAVICARLKGPFFILSTLAAAEVVRIGALNWASLTGGPEGLSIPPTANVVNVVFASKAAYAALMLAYLVVCYAVTKSLELSRHGYYLFAVRDDDDAARAAGINSLLVRTCAMALSAALTGIGGSLFAQYFLYLDPTFVISPELSFQFALLPAVGGLGTAIGLCSGRSWSRRSRSCCDPTWAMLQRACTW